MADPEAKTSADCLWHRQHSANGVRPLAALRLSQGCHYNGVIDISRYGDDVPAPSSNSRLCYAARFAGHTGTTASSKLTFLLAAQ